VIRCWNKQRKQRDILCDVVGENPKKSQRQLAKPAAASGIGRDKAEQLLKAGIGKYWAVSEGAKGKLSYKLPDYGVFLGVVNELLEQVTVSEFRLILEAACIAPSD
jgi:hypothetical protein